MANASDPDEASERQKEPSCVPAISEHTLEDARETHVSGGELGHVFVHHLLGSVLSQDGVDEGVVDITEDRDGSIDLGEFCRTGCSARVSRGR